jgi:hypothetical protein
MDMTLPACTSRFLWQCCVVNRSVLPIGNASLVRRLGLLGIHTRYDPIDNQSSSHVDEQMNIVHAGLDKVSLAKRAPMSSFLMVSKCWTVGPR